MVLLRQRLWACRVRAYGQREWFIAGRYTFDPKSTSPVRLALFSTRREAREAISQELGLVGSAVPVSITIRGVHGQRR